MEDELKQAAARACNLCGITPHSDMRIFAEHAAMVAIKEERERCTSIAYRLCAEDRELKLAYRIREAITGEKESEFLRF